MIKLIITLLMSLLPKRDAQQRPSQAPQHTPLHYTDATSTKEVITNVVHLYPQVQNHKHTHRTRRIILEDRRKQYKEWVQNNKDLQRLRSQII